MKKIILFSSFCILINCSKQDVAPNCDDSNVKNAVTTFLSDYYSERTPGMIYKIENIRTNFKDSESKTCDCTADFKLINYDEINTKYSLSPIFQNMNNKDYIAQISSDGFVNITMKTSK